MIKEKIRNQNLKTKILWGLGLLIIAVVFIYFVQGPPSEADRNKDWETFRGSPFYSRTIEFDDKGHPWIGTWKGIKNYDGENWRSITIGSPVSGKSIIDFAFDSQGRVWVLSSPGSIKLAIYDGEQWITYTDDNTPLEEFEWFHSITFDASNRAWLPSGDQIWIFDGSDWTNLSVPPTPSRGVNFLEFDQSGRIWIGLNPGVHVYHSGNWESYTKENSGIIGDRIYSFCSDHDDTIWIGGEGGVSFFDGVSWTNYHWGSDLLHDDVVAIEIDSSGRILFLSDSALRILDGDNWLFYNSFNSGYPNEVDADMARDLAIGPGGSIGIAFNHAVAIATVDDAGLPYGISPEREFFSEYYFFGWSNLLGPILILTLLSSWIAISLEDFLIVIASAIIGLTLFIVPPGSDLGRPIILFILIGGIAGSLIGGRIKRRRRIESTLPTTIGFIVGALAGFGGLFIFTELLFYFSYFG